MKIAIYDISFLKKSLAGNIKHGFLLQINDLVVKCFDVPHMAAVIRDYENISHFPNKVDIISSCLDSLSTWVGFILFITVLAIVVYRSSHKNSSGCKVCRVG